MKTPTTRNRNSTTLILPHLLCAAFAILLSLTTAQNTNAATFTVNDNGDASDITAGNGVCETATGNGACTLRAAVVEANGLPGDDVINFDASIALITLTSGSEIAISSTITINGTGANVLTIDGGAGTNRVFYIFQSFVTITDITLTGGNGGGLGLDRSGGAIYAGNATLVLNSVHVTANWSQPGGNGGGIYFLRGSNHQILNSTFSANTSGGSCGGFFSDLSNGGLSVTNSTISGNTARDDGGGFCSSGDTTLRSVTVTNNTLSGANSDGGGILNVGGTLNLGNTIVAGNTGGTRPDIDLNSGTITAAGGNLIGDNTGAAAAFPTGNPNANGDKVGMAGSPIDPLLGPLQNNGGPTPTRALLVGSPAIDTGINANAAGLLRDERGEGFPRIRDGNGDGTPTVDIGAFEFQAAPTAAGVSISGRVTTANGRGISNVRITLLDSNGNARTALTSSFGYYTFADAAAGQTYVLTANAKRITFSQPSQVLNVFDNAVNVNFIAH